MNRPKRILRVKPAPVVIVRRKPRRSRRNAKRTQNSNKSKDIMKPCKAKVTRRVEYGKKEKAEETQDSGSSEIAEIEAGAKSVALAPKPKQNPSEISPVVERRLTKQELKKLDKLF
jgi:hypothetical protein